MGVNSTATSSDIRKFLITSNTSGQKDIRRLVVELNYEESVFDVSIRVSAVVIDGGGDPGGASVKSGCWCVPEPQPPRPLESKNLPSSPASLDPSPLSLEEGSAV